MFKPKTLILLGLSTVLSMPAGWGQEPDDQKPRRERRARNAQNADQSSTDGETQEGQRRRRRAAEGRAAEGDQPEAGRGPMGGQLIRRLPLMVALDADKDGKLSAEEIANATAQLKTLDKNGDGELTANELLPAGFGGPAGQGRPGNAGQNPGMNFKRLLENRDKDGDGKLSGDEIPPQFSQRLEQIDINGDGAIDEDEFAVIAERFQNRNEENRRERPADGSGVRPRRPGNSEPSPADGN